MLLQRPYRQVMLALFLLGSLVWGWLLPGLQFRIDQHSLLDPADPDVQRWKQVEQIFPSGDEMLIIGISDTLDLLQPERLHRQWELTEALRLTEGVTKVSGIANVPYLVIDHDSAWAKPFYQYAGTDSAAFDSLRLLGYPDVHPKFLSADRKAACLYLFYSPDLPMAHKKGILNAARSVVLQYFPISPVVYSPSILQEEQIEAMRRESWQLGLCSGLLCLALIWSAFRSRSATLFPMMIIALTVLWALGLMVLFGLPITPASLSIPGVLAVVSLSDIIHILSAIQDSPPHLPMEERVRMALKEMRRPVTFTALTTFLGFFLLTFTGVPPVQHYGLIASAGVIFSWTFSLLLAPNLLVAMNIGLPAPVRKRSGWAIRLVRLVAATGKPMPIIALFGIAFCISLWFASDVKLNSPLYEDIGRKDELGKMLMFFENQFSGIRAINWIVIPADSGAKLTDPEPIRQLDQLESFISDIANTEDVYAPATEVKRIWRAWQGGDPMSYVVPENTMILKKLRKEITMYYDTLGLSASLTRGQDTALLTGRMHDQGSYSAGIMYQRLDSAVAAGAFPALKIVPTGLAYLVDQSARNMFSQLKYGLLFEVLLVGGIWWIQTKSLRMSLLALVPNLLPMIMLLGIMGALDIPLKFSTMGVFTIIFGISVDDTIHYLHRFRMERSTSGMTAQGAARRATLACGKPMILTTMTLVAGFGILTLSSFHGTFLSGALTGSCLFLAMVTDLWLHPALQVILSSDR